MTVVAQSRVSSPYPSEIAPGTLRAWLEQRLSTRAISLDDALAVIVPLTVEVAELHRQGYGLYVHPSSISEDSSGKFHVSSELSASFPSHPRDLACMPPEASPTNLSDAKANVYSLGALLYELVTGKTAGPGIERPRSINPSLPVGLETLLSRALIPDPAHRPEDLYALAQALHHLASTGRIPAPPPADESQLEISVDVSLSLLPPPNDANGRGPALVIAPPPAAVPMVEDPTTQLANLKSQLESDPRPRYVVIKQGMDHGPFTAVELLQQIASHRFAATDELRDDVDGVQKPIAGFEGFAPFAEHAQMHREIQQEKDAIVRVARAENKSLRSKAVVGALLFALLLVVGLFAFTRFAGHRRDDVDVQADTVTNVESEGSLKPDKNARGRGRPGAGGGRMVAAGQSCEAAVDAYKGDEVRLDGTQPQRGPADLTAGQYGAYLNNGSYLNACGVSSNMEVRICAAVQNGRAVGVTVTTSPKDPGRAGCIARHIRGLTFPSRPNLDVTRTTFAAQ